MTRSLSLLTNENLPPTTAQEHKHRALVEDGLHLASNTEARLTNPTTLPNRQLS